MKKRMSVILALTMAATTMFSAVPAMAKDGDVVNITIWSPTDREQVEAWWTEKIAEWNEANPNIQVHVKQSTVPIPTHMTTRLLQQ